MQTGHHRSMRRRARQELDEHVHQVAIGHDERCHALIRRRGGGIEREARAVVVSA